MKKYLLIGLVAVIALSFQSCKRSVDAIAKDYCVEMKKIMEARKDGDMEQLQKSMMKYNEKMAEYVQANPGVEAELQSAVQKYVVELKLDSIEQEIQKEQMQKQMQQMQTPPAGAAPQAAPQAGADQPEIQAEVVPVEGDEAPAK